MDLNPLELKKQLVKQLGEALALAQRIAGQLQLVDGVIDLMRAGSTEPTAEPTPPSK